MKRWLLILALLPGALVAWRLWRPLPPPPVPQRPPAAVPEEEVDDTLAGIDHLLGLGPAAPYPEIAARPLFFRDRRPPAQAEPSDEPAPEKPRPAGKAPRIRLHAIIGEGDTLEALVTLPRERTPTRLSSGDRVEGWQVEAIEPDHIVLRNGARREKIPLRSYKPVPPMAPRPHRPPPRRTPARKPPRPAAAVNRRAPRPAGTPEP